MSYLIDCYNLRDQLSVVAGISAEERFIIVNGEITGCEKPSVMQNGVKWFSNNVYGEDLSSKRAIGIIHELVTKILLKIKEVDKTNLSSLELSNRKDMLKNLYETLSQLKGKGISNFITTIQNDGARITQASEDLKSENIALLARVGEDIQKVQNIAKNIFRGYENNQCPFVNKFSFDNGRNDSLSGFLCWLRDPNITRNIVDPLNFYMYDVRHALQREFSAVRVDATLERYGLNNEKLLNRSATHALFYGLSATMTKADLDVFLSQSEHKNLSPIEIVKHYRSLKTNCLNIENNSIYKKELEKDLGILTLQKIFDNYRIKQYLVGGNPAKPFGYIELLELYYIHCFDHNSPATDPKDCCKNEGTLLLYPLPKGQTMLIQVHTLFFKKHNLLFIIAAPVNGEGSGIQVVCRKTANQSASVLSLGYWLGQPSSEPFSIDDEGREVFDKIFSFDSYPEKQASIEFIGFDNECNDLIETMKLRLLAYQKNNVYTFHEKAKNFSHIYLYTSNIAPILGNEDEPVIVAPYKTSHSYL